MWSLLIGPPLNGNKRIGQLIQSPSACSISLLDSENCWVHEDNNYLTTKIPFPHHQQVNKFVMLQ